MASAERVLAEACSACLVLGAVAQWLPPIVTVFALWHYLTMFYESPLNRRWARQIWAYCVRARYRCWSTEDKTLAIVLGLTGCGIAMMLTALGAFQ